ncbi:bifunctional 4-hydroxy-2-oxoglutarate aldolase/2-dehydro-3-deoxy-phosphogluconate aldolase [Anaerostipes sp.]|uniref:bifunctional 4-hydroxy-2-oxoglutarate aldolase/2-dehydro-3-deoxy-phosphogluconate aldolase n=1 Tax=Anaerostipes sp. TaxID=1872530 RepID=UPI0025B85F97|nr:bifunctional 4-hydroxy-2-oxoglutarate aldolase/2-dehydro-3-deoxy-phosphogluconate aldolase [Anaerostipes sp.]MBS7006845.1 bifunctional 4-hydroxy-2-oxoglutarate aldolase/2-dehydro-3-deoxy-phosphogluconate aldolase [Anaerostipes sp.]
MNDVLCGIQDIGIVPVICLKDAGKAVPLAEALCEGGIPCAEVTFRTEACVDSIKRMSESCPGMLVGAGTVTKTEQAEQAVRAGARFIVSPGFNPEVVRYCTEHEITVIPGCSNPSDVEQAMAYGLELVKFFPAEAAGGVNMLRALAGPYSGMKFMPTGGITEENLKDYMELTQVAACGGSFMAPEKMVEKGDFISVKAMAEKTVRRMLGFELAHVGINMESRDEAVLVAGMFESIFGFQKSENDNSIFAGSYIEAMKYPFLGEKGHIAVRTDDAGRAVSYFKRRGYAFREESASYKTDGSLGAVYFRQEIGGFAVHLVQK